MQLSIDLFPFFKSIQSSYEWWQNHKLNKFNSISFGCFGFCESRCSQFCETETQQVGLFVCFFFLFFFSWIKITLEWWNQNKSCMVWLCPVIFRNIPFHMFSKWVSTHCGLFSRDRGVFPCRSAVDLNSSLTLKIHLSKYSKQIDYIKEVVVRLQWKLFMSFLLS